MTSAFRSAPLPAGGGIYLERGWSLGRVHLNESEAVGLLLSVALARRIDSPLLLGAIRSAERKLTAAFAPAQAARVRGLRRRVLVGADASPAVVATYRPPDAAISHALLDAFMAQRMMTVRYSDQNDSRSTRTIEVHYLLYSLPVWYALAWDHLRSAARSFRVDRIQEIQPSNSNFRLRDLELFVDTTELDARSV